jgi:hypothetical protein
MESETPFTKPMVVSKATDRLRRLLYERTLLVLTIMFCTGVVIILWHVYRLQSNLIVTVCPSIRGVSHPLHLRSCGSRTDDRRRGDA